MRDRPSERRSGSTTPVGTWGAIYTASFGAALRYEQLLKGGQRAARVSGALGRNEILDHSLDLEISGWAFAGALLTAAFPSGTIRNAAVRLWRFFTPRAALAGAS